MLSLCGCAQGDLQLGEILPEDIIYDAPQPRAQPQLLARPAAWTSVATVAPRIAADARRAPAPVVKTGGWDSSVFPAAAPPPPPVMAWGPAAVTSFVAPSGPVGPHPYLLNTGDKLRIFVYGQPSLSRIYMVDQMGDIAVPLIGNVRARDSTATQLARSIAARLARDFVRDPQVTVDVVQNRPFFILGEVRLPGQYPFVSEMTVETAVAIAGGYTERASERCFRITRRINGLVDEIEAPSDYPLQPGDTVYVYERFL
jgi:polysaccharide export outer membrane protein